MPRRKHRLPKTGTYILSAALSLALTASPISAFALDSTGPVTRGDFLQAITQAIGVKEQSPYTFHFTDVKPNSPDSVLLEKARFAGMIAGFPDQTAKLQDAVTREQAAVMIAKAKKLPLKASSANGYKDADKISNWSKGYVGAVTEAGYMSALSDGGFGPQTKLAADELKRLAEALRQVRYMDVVSAKAVSSHIVEVVLNGKVSAFDGSDIRLTAATGSWSDLDPKLERPLTVKNITSVITEDHRTVLRVEIEESLEADGTILPAAKGEEIPYLKAEYYTGDMEKDTVTADHILTYQINGGWSKETPNFVKEKGPWDGQFKRASWINGEGVELATIDNNATTDEILFLSYMYGKTKDERYKQAVQDGLGMLLKMQYPSGGWPQTYPARGNYSDYVTFNDNAMIRVMNILTLVKDKKFPFDSDVVDDGVASSIQTALDTGLDYILKSQIVANGQLTAWCAQSDPVTYEPKEARAYEHPSISGSESVGIIAYLMSLPNPTPDVKKAIDSALRYFQEVRVDGMKFDKKDPNGIYILPDPEKTIWYRFYEIGTNKPIFSGRDGIIKHNVNEIELERIQGYSWTGEWPSKILNIAATTGYYENKVYVQLIGNASKSDAGLTLEKGKLTLVTGSK
ncbi:pectate lyase [Paenibacillus rigui]|uniref:Pectate lyase n=1 Tax=Paenibacillus rigui TaxID=554312 RepID=A0A229UGN2_9BACL|nr:pectate lyase [Paenibacillus rigui]OXM82556.1 pectate lyase [Paenibacillus rigui]